MTVTASWSLIQTHPSSPGRRRCFPSTRRSRTFASVLSVFSICSNLALQMSDVILPAVSTTSQPHKTRSMKAQPAICSKLPLQVTMRPSLPTAPQVVVKFVTRLLRALGGWVTDSRFLQTHTISGTPEDPGVVYRLMQSVFDRIEATKEQTHVELTVSYLE